MDQYVAAIHFAMTTMATVGYGDVAPRTRTERLVAMVIMGAGAHYSNKSCVLSCSAVLCDYGPPQRCALH
jgi:hypothetical protein